VRKQYHGTIDAGNGMKAGFKSTSSFGDHTHTTQLVLSHCGNCYYNRYRCVIEFLIILPVGVAVVGMKSN